MRPIGSFSAAPGDTASTTGSLIRLRRIFASHPLEALRQAENRFYETIAQAAIVAIRIALGLVFFWFGILKLLPIHIPIDTLAQAVLTEITFHRIPASVLLHILGVWECVIGLGLLFRRFLRVAIGLLFLQLPGTFLPLVLLRHETWYHFPWLPTFEGQYIIKNLILISSGVVIAVTSRGGQIITNPLIARRAKRVEIAKHDQEIRLVERKLRDDSTGQGK
jgi:uncharacterized membrane protein YphA (DoxX/SURF4 family)